MAWYDKIVSEKTQKKFAKHKKLIYSLLLSFAIIEIIVLVTFPRNETEQIKEKKRKEQAAQIEAKANANAAEQGPETYSHATDEEPSNKMKTEESNIEVYQFANKNKKHGLLATVENGMPRVRGMSLIKIIDKKWYFATSKKKAVSKQIREHPYAEWITYDQHNVSLRVLGKITIVEDLEIKQQAVDDIPSLKAAYGDKIATEFDLFYMEVSEVNWYGR